MAGLESIARAVAHLEQLGESGTANRAVSDELGAPTADISKDPTSYPVTGVVRSAFGTAARLVSVDDPSRQVSTDSTLIQNHQNSPSSRLPLDRNRSWELLEAIRNNERMTLSSAPPIRMVSSSFSSSSLATDEGAQNYSPPLDRTVSKDSIFFASSSSSSPPAAFLTDERLAVNALSVTKQAYSPNPYVCKAPITDIWAKRRVSINQSLKTAATIASVSLSEDASSNTSASETETETESTCGETAGGDDDAILTVTDASVEMDGFRLGASIEEILCLKFSPQTTDTPGTSTAARADENITKVRLNDVLCGRGGETNHHAGNVQFRGYVKACRPAYIQAKRRDKPRIAAQIVQAVRAKGGRFLKKVSSTSNGSKPTPAANEFASAANCHYVDVGNSKAREKTSQALREGAPELRTVIKVPSPTSKATFNKAPNSAAKKMKRASYTLKTAPAPVTKKRNSMSAISPVSTLDLSHHDPSKSLLQKSTSISRRYSLPTAKSQVHHAVSLAQHKKRRISEGPSACTATAKEATASLSWPSLLSPNEAAAALLRAAHSAKEPSCSNSKNKRVELALSADDGNVVNQRQQHDFESIRSTTMVDNEEAGPVSRGPRIKWFKQRLSKDSL